MKKDVLRKKLGDLAFDVTQNNGTEPPFSGKYFNFFKEGIYVDIVSGEVLFSSKDKFFSNCGWPAFSKPIDEAAISYVKDYSFGMKRIEVRSKVANSHLGHVFDENLDNETGLRYCINSAALRFIPVNEMAACGYEDYLYLFK